MRLVVAVLASLVLLASAASDASGERESPSSQVLQASDPQAERAARRSRAESPGWSSQLERELMSPYCPGRSLLECPSQQAVELRLWIAAQERAGVSRESVEAELFRRYGDRLRHLPRAEGFGLLAYLVPAAALLAGGGLVFTYLRRQGQGPRTPPSPLPARDPDLERRLDEELAG